MEFGFLLKVFQLPVLKNKRICDSWFEEWTKINDWSIVNNLFFSWINVLPKSQYYESGLSTNLGFVEESNLLISQASKIP